MSTIDLFDDAIGVGGPDEGFGFAVVLAEIAIDCCLPVDEQMEGSALQAPTGSAWQRTLAGAHPRWVFHFTPTSCSWANAVEGFFATLTRRRLQRGVFHSLVDLQAAINRYLGEHNRKPRPFVWTADPDRIIEKVNRGTKDRVRPLGPKATIPAIWCGAAKGSVRPRAVTPAAVSLWASMPQRSHAVGFKA